MIEDCMLKLQGPNTIPDLEVIGFVCDVLVGTGFAKRAVPEWDEESGKFLISYEKSIV